MRGRMRDFPKELIIGESSWKVRWRRSIPEGGDRCVGLCDPETKTIHIRMGQTPAERVSTLLHELMHCAEVEYKFELKHKDIYRLEGPLAQILLQNAWVQWADWQTEEEAC